MLSFKSQVGKVKIDLTTGGFTIIFPKNKFVLAELYSNQEHIYEGPQKKNERLIFIILAGGIFSSMYHNVV